MGNRNIKIDEIEDKINNSEKIYSKLIDELNYSTKNMNLDLIDETLDICRQVYFHIKSIELLEKELYLTKENHKKLKKLYKNDIIKLKINEKESPVFNFHLNKIIEKMNMLNQLIDVKN